MDKRKKVFTNVIENYQNLEKSIVQQLCLKVDNHGTTCGTNREYIWKTLFEQLIPKKLNIAQSVFIIDSYGNVSNEVDLAIFDEQYTPYIFRYGKIQFIPIEAVAAVIECKSKTLKKEDLGNWVEEIKKLKTNSESITRLATNITGTSAPTQKYTRPIIINCNLAKEEYDKDFDIVLSADEKAESIKIIINGGEETPALDKWFLNLNFANHEDEGNVDKLCYDTKLPKVLKKTKLEDYCIRKEGKEISLLSLNFMLNQLLMLINNPMFFPHMAYVEMFNKVLEEQKEESEE